MPRIFMTYVELAETFGGDPVSARAGAIECGLSRFKGSDGVTYVGLSPAMTAEFLGQLTRRALADSQTTAQVASLNALASAMRDAIQPPTERIKTAA
ncbi:MAG: hypothetical protein Q8R85_03385 [Bosea sp. (in: a-proteobacteria)]|uniref:hypothetical protein n=1 Tax=Bosea sp. (in: a-proteobacteria) TaxID=1871050 RepID=UPI002733702C|nr:hypothetical protein [Bosea sp. (in: a-proteobacteria)]MDP3600193.1 hypothetical protein [Bosea sp. (in: a-proteobacteria)]